MADHSTSIRLSPRHFAEFRARALRGGEVTLRSEDPAPRRHDHPAPAAVQPADTAALAAQGIAAALLPLTQAPAFRNQLLLQLARSLRHTLAEGHHPATTTRERIDRSIAQAMATILPPGSPAEQIADLRMYAHLTLSECADLLDRPRLQLLQLWRPTRRLLFRWVRSNLSRRSVPPPTVPD